MCRVAVSRKLIVVNATSLGVGLHPETTTTMQMMTTTRITTAVIHENDEQQLLRQSQRDNIIRYRLRRRTPWCYCSSCRTDFTFYSWMTQPSPWTEQAEGKGKCGLCRRVSGYDDGKLKVLESYLMWIVGMSIRVIWITAFIFLFKVLAPASPETTVP